MKRSAFPIFSKYIFAILACFLSYGLISAQPAISKTDAVLNHEDVLLTSHPDFPTPNHGDTYVIAHRGAHNGIPENSLAAYQKAIDLGCDFVEIDARTTSDGAIVSIHNSTIDAYVTGETGRVKAMTLQEIKALDIGKRVSLEWENTKVPTFEEILQLCQGKIGIYLDLKDASIIDLVSLIKKYQMERQVIWCIPASRVRTIREVQKNCPNCIPMPDPGGDKNIEKIIEDFKPLVIAPVMRDFNRALVETAHRYKVKVFVDDSEDDPELLKKEWKEILDLNTDGIQTDQPELLINLIKERLY